jgi:transcriptional regulator with XRE-family HTH domain
MIRFNLLILLEKLEGKLGRKVTLKEVAEKSGCDKNALSRLVNQPQIIPSANVIDKLAQYFFFELTRDGDKPHLDRNRMRSVIKDFVSVFPDDEKFWQGIPASIKNRSQVQLSEIWDIYTSSHRPVHLVSPKLIDLKTSIKAKLIEAEEVRQEGGDIELSLTPEEFDLIRQQLPKNMGGTKEN